MHCRDPYGNRAFKFSLWCMPAFNNIFREWKGKSKWHISTLLRLDLDQHLGLHKCFCWIAPHTLVCVNVCPKVSHLHHYVDNLMLTCSTHNPNRSPVECISITDSLSFHSLCKLTHKGHGTSWMGSIPSPTQKQHPFIPKNWVKMHTCFLLLWSQS